MTNASAAAYDLADLRRLASLLFVEPARVVEIRILNAGRAGTVSGYFDNPEAFVTACAAWSGKAPGLYVTLNPCAPALLARSANRLKERAPITTADTDILTRRWLPLDFDAVRPSGISSTDTEHQAALTRAEACQGWLTSLGWPTPVAADSGNGGHRVYAVDLPNDETSRALVQRVLQAVSLRFSDADVVLDEKVFNAARIWKAYGTMACKGDSTAERPHRLARLTLAPEPLQVVPSALLERVAALLPPEPPKAVRHTSAAPFDLVAWIARYRLPVAAEGAWNGGYKWVLSPCPWQADHTNRAAYIVQFVSGAIAAGCHHNGCAGRDWPALRDLYEPDWRERRDAWEARHAQDTRRQGPRLPGKGSESDDDVSRVEESPLPEQAPWPVLDEAAYYGLAGDIVRTIEPHTEGDPVAVLVQFLVMVGNMLHRTAYYPIEADAHRANLYAGIVGKTARGRKGTAAGYPRRLLCTLDEEWRRPTGGLSSGEGIIWNVRDAIGEEGKKSYDAGVNDKRLCILQTEFAGALKKMSQEGNILSQVLRDAWDHGTLGSLTSGRIHSPVKATDAHISVIAHITLAELQRLLSETEAASGFANRFLWVCAQRSKLLPDGGSYPDQALRPLVTRLRSTLAEAHKIGRMHRDAAARDLWRQLYPVLTHEHPGLLGAITSRAEAQALRLSMLYALLDATDTITTAHINAADALWRYCDASARYIFGERLGDPKADELLQMLRTAGPAGMTRTQMYQALGCNTKSEVISATLSRLQRENLVYATRQTGKGRPTETWHPYVKNVFNVLTHHNGSTPTFPASPVEHSKYVLSPSDGDSGAPGGLNTYSTLREEHPAEAYTSSPIGLNTFNTFNTYPPCVHREVEETSTVRVCRQCGVIMERECF